MKRTKGPKVTTTEDGNPDLQSGTDGTPLQQMEGPGLIETLCQTGEDPKSPEKIVALIVSKNVDFCRSSTNGFCGFLM